MDGFPARLTRWRWLAGGAVFLALLWLSPLQSVFRAAPEPKRAENRKLADAPRRPRALEDWLGWRLQANAWFDDRFGFRKTLVRAHHMARLKLFGISPVSKVIAGEEGWLYLSARRSDPATQLGDPFTEQELARWTRDLEARQAAIEAQGARFVYFVAPDKRTIYPEYLPARIRESPIPTRIAQLTAHLAAHSRVEPLDLRPALLAAKPELRVFHRTDNHWNGLGGYVAYRALMARLEDTLPVGAPRPLAGFRLRRNTAGGMNLARMLAMGDLYEEEVLWLEPREAPSAVEVEAWSATGRRNYREKIFERPGSGLPRAVMLHDSFGDAMARFLAEHFSRIVFVRSRGPELRVVRREQPDVVILEVGEGSLERPRLD